MTRRHLLGITCFALISFASTSAFAAPAAGAQDSAAAKAVKASPDLIGQLSKELGSTPEQAAGAAGSLFSVAKSQLKPAEFAQISKAVPGMGSLLSAAPALGALSQVGGMAGGLGNAAAAFSKLGLSPDLVAKAVPILTSFVTKSGGANVGKLLAGVLK